MKKFLNISEFIILTSAFVIFVLWIGKVVPEADLSKILTPLCIILLLHMLFEYATDFYNLK